MPRKFKSGEWVTVKGKLTSPKMQVIKYVSKKDSLFGLVNNDTYLQCVWYKNGERKIKVYHQNKLIKMIETDGLLKKEITNSKLSLS